MKIFNFQSYKKAKIIYEDLQNIHKALLTSKQLLKPYGKYVPVRKLYSSILENEADIVEALKRCKKIIETKGNYE